MPPARMGSRASENRVSREVGSEPFSREPPRLEKDSAGRGGELVMDQSVPPTRGIPLTVGAGSSAGRGRHASTRTRGALAIR